MAFYNLVIMVLCSSNNNGTLNAAAVTLSPVPGQAALRGTLFSTLLQLEHLAIVFRAPLQAQIRRSQVLLSFPN